MADIIAELVVQITGDTKDFDKKIDKTEKNVKKKSKNIVADTLNIKGAFKQLLSGFAVIAIVKGFADIGTASINAASDAEETQNKFNVVFSGISDQANTMADNLAIAYGTSKSAAKDMLAGTGDLLTGLGFTQDSAFDLSKQVLTLGADLASFTNFSGGAEGASQILTKALLGERESLKGLGISLNEADVKAEILRQTQQGLIFDTEKQAKAQATLTLVLGQTANAQGDFARSSESYANQLKVAKARTSDLQVELGRALLPTATKGIGVFSELTGKLGAYIKSLNDVRDAEKAQASGIATREQELFLAEEKIKAQDKILEKLKKQAEFDKEEFGRVIQRTKIDTDNAKDKLDLLNRVANGIRKQINEEVALADKVRAGIKAEEDRKKAQEEAATARQKQHDTDIANIEKIQEASKTDLEILNDEIQSLKDITGLTESENQKRLSAIETLQGDKQRIMDEEVEARERAGEETLQANQEFIDAELEAEKNKFDEKVSLYEGYASQVLELADSIIQIANNVSENELANLERETQAKIASLALETEAETAFNAFKAQLSAEDAARELTETTQKIADLIAIGDEDSLQQAADLQRNVDNAAEFTRLDQEAVASRETRAADIEDIEKELARKKYEIELAQFQANKATSILEAGISTAAGIAASLPNLVLAGIVGGLGLVQVAAIASTPDPARPAFAQGGVAARATTAIVGEDGGDVLLGMGAAGAPLIDELATRIGSKIGGSGQTVININSLYPPTQQALDRLAKDLYNGNIKEQQRRGI
jgi:hypothetical protein